MPRSNTVTTPQIVRTMKRGENGSSNVSMGPSGKSCDFYYCRPRPNPKPEQSFTRYPAEQVMDMTALAIRLPDHPAQNQSVAAKRPMPAIGPFAVQRRLASNGSVPMRAHLLGNPAFLE